MDLTALEAQVLQLLDDDGTYYQPPAVRDALNEAQRFFALITLSLELTATFMLTTGQAFYHMLPAFPDWLLPRRVYNSSGQRLRPGRLSDLDAVNTSWQTTAGTPARYAHTGLDFLAIYPQPHINSDFLTIVYAQAPPLLVSPLDVPVLRENSHFALANYAAYALRQPEGGSEFSKGLGYLNDFLDEAQLVQTLMRAKNLDARYEKPPFELDKMDRSRLLAA